MLYGWVTDIFGYYWLSTWGLWLLSVSILVSPWVFNPQSFKFYQVQANFLEFLMWLDNEPGVTKGMGSWRKWHEHTIDFARKQSRLKRLFIFFLRQVTAFLIAS